MKSPSGAVGRATDVDKLTDLFREYGVPTPVRIADIVGKTVSYVTHDDNRMILFFTDGTGLCAEYDRRVGFRSGMTLGDWAHSYAFAARCALTTSEAEEARLFDMQHKVADLLNERVEELERIEYERLKAKYGG
jgi:hypothetical protein